jgi:hypothetical protein
MHLNIAVPKGHVAERRGTGLQNLIRRFNSVHDLNKEFFYMASNRRRDCISIRSLFMRSQLPQKTQNVHRLFCANLCLLWQKIFTVLECY